MSVTLSLFAGAGAQFLDNNGSILSGGKIYTYNAGTTTPLTTYTSNLGTVAHPNPIVLDSSGRIPTGEIWLSTGFGYKFVVKDANDVLIGTYDNIPSSAQPLIVNDASSISYEEGYTVNAGSFVVGQTYLITFLGTTNFQLIGASANQVGVLFIATGVGSGTGTAKFSRTVQAKLQESISVKDFGAIGNGTTDDTIAIQAAINSSNGNLSIYFPSGTYLVTSTITFAYDKYTIHGDAANTKIKFAPTSDNQVCFLFQKLAGNSSVQHTVRDLTFYSNDLTYTKTGIKLVDISECLFENIVTTYPHWYGGAGSIFLNTCGRDTTAIKGLNVYANKPIVISQNPNSTISLDHFHFSDCYLGSNGYPIVTVNDGCNLTHITFDGYQSWVGGTYGFYWNDTTTIGVSVGLSINNVRWEQQIGSSGYFIYINHHYGLQQLTLQNIYGSITANGFYLRRCTQVKFSQVFYIGSLIAFDADNSNNLFTFDGLFFNDSAATINLSATGLTGTYFSGGNSVSYTPSYVGGSVQKFNPNDTLGYSQLTSIPVVVPPNTAITFCNNTALMTIIINSNGISAIYNIKGTSNSTSVLVTSDAAWFGSSIGASAYNIYWDGAKYVIQNNTSSQTAFQIVAIGS